MSNLPQRAAARYNLAFAPGDVLKNYTAALDRLSKTISTIWKAEAGALDDIIAQLKEADATMAEVLLTADAKREWLEKEHHQQD